MIMHWLRAILIACAYLAGCPIAGGLLAAAFSFFMHWISGEGNELGSGDPWLMVGAMLFFPVAVLCGGMLGIVQAFNTLWDAWFNPPANTTDE